MIGGTAGTADVRHIRVRRPSGETVMVDLNRLLFQGDQTQDVWLEGGEQVFIPEVSSNRVYVMGEVAEPGVYYIEDGLTVLEAVLLAGSYTDDALLRSTRVIRGGLANPRIIMTDLSRLITKADARQNISLELGDIVWVPRRGLASWNRFLSDIGPAVSLVRDGDSWRYDSGTRWGN